VSCPTTAPWSWETGDDVIVRGPTSNDRAGPRPAGPTGTEKLFDDEVVNARDFMNEGGSSLVAGQFALEGAWEQQTYNPLGSTPPRPFCRRAPRSATVRRTARRGRRRRVAPSLTTSQQYWLGAYSTLDGGDPSTAELQELAAARGPDVSA